MARFSRRQGLLATVAVLGLLASACSSETDTSTSTEGEESAEAAVGFSSNQLDASVLAGTATTTTGETFDIGALADKDLVVWFWAPW